MPEERPSPETVLEYLYGLLEPMEATRVRDWLETSEGVARGPTLGGLRACSPPRPR